MQVNIILNSIKTPFNKGSFVMCNTVKWISTLRPSLFWALGRSRKKFEWSGVNI